MTNKEYKNEYRIGDKIGFDPEDSGIETESQFSVEELSRFQGDWIILEYKKQGVICQYLCEGIGFRTYVPFSAVVYVDVKNKYINEKVTFDNIREHTLYIYKGEFYVLDEHNYENKSLLMYGAIDKFYGTKTITEFVSKDIAKLIRICE